MKKNKTDMNSVRSIQEWEELVDRYLDAMTTDEEEKELRDFLLSPESAGDVFDEARAVMGFLKTGQFLHRKKKENIPFKKAGYLKVAAVLGGIMVGTALWSAWEKTQNVCEAYIFGIRHTEVALVMSQVQHSLDKVNYPEEEDIVEAQLSDFFQMMEEE